MYKKLALVFMAAFLTIIPLSNAFSDTLTREKGSISVSINDSRTAKPDECVITFTVETTDKDPKKASDINKQTTNTVLKALKAKVNVSRGDKIETSGYSVAPNYRYDKDKRILENYLVKNEVTLDLKTTQDIGEYIDVAVKNGANRVNGIEFRLEKYQRYCDELIKNSTRDAYNQASLVAQSMNTSIDGIKNISISCYPQNQRMTVMPRYMGKALLATGADESTPIESSDIIININLNANFYVK